MKVMFFRSTWFIILMLLLFGIVGNSIFYFFIENLKLSNLLIAIATGLITYMFSFFMTKNQYDKIEQFKLMRIKNILVNRRDTEYYKDIIKDAKFTVDVMGTSCLRFIDDFANEKNADHILIDALKERRGLVVRILIPNAKNMDSKSLTSILNDIEKFEYLQHNYAGQVEFRCFNFGARVSLVQVDDNLIVGPVFQNESSRDTPAIHLNKKSPYAEKYIKYYDWVWKDENSEEVNFDDYKYKDKT